MYERLTERIHSLIDVILHAGGWGSVTVVIERGHITRIVWSVDERVNEPHS